MQTDPIQELQRRGELVLTGGGALILTGLPLRLFRWIDAQLLQLAGEVDEISCPSLIAPQVLERADYFKSFPLAATRVEGGPHSGLLAPAVCYHCFAKLTEACLETPAAITCSGKCYRHENGATDTMGRLWEFTMREFVVIATPELVEEQRRTWIEKIRSFASSIGLEGEVRPATDPFFGTASRGRKLLQQLKQLKYEFSVDFFDGSRHALASFNLHETFFTSRFAIRMAGGPQPYSGCIAFGLERWMLAILAQRGVEHSAELCG
jgi:seryl-tRNA synthetase